jgi:molybdopterin converting factor small subunit
MIVRVNLFAAAKQAAGTGEVAVEVSPQAKLADVEAALVKLVPPLASIANHARWAVDAEFASRDATITPESEIALIPPVSGG